MSVISLILGTRNDHMRQNLSRMKVNTSRSEIKLSDRHCPSSPSICYLKKRIIGKNRRHTVSADRTVADISSDRTYVSDLRTSDLIYRFPKHRNTLLNNRVCRNMRKYSSCTYINISGIFLFDSFDFFNVTD